LYDLEFGICLVGLESRANGVAEGVLGWIGDIAEVENGKSCLWEFFQLLQGTIPNPSHRGVWPERSMLGTGMPRPDVVLVLAQATQRGLAAVAMLSRRAMTG
jgi:hypothetical protein